MTEALGHRPEGANQIYWKFNKWQRQRSIVLFVKLCNARSENPKNIGDVFYEDTRKRLLKKIYFYIEARDNPDLFGKNRWFT